MDGFQTAPFYGKGRDRTAVFSTELINIVDRVEIPAIWRKRQKTGIDRGACQSEGRQCALIGIPAEGVNSPAGAALVIGIRANKNDPGWFAGP